MLITFLVKSKGDYRYFSQLIFYCLRFNYKVIIIEKTSSKIDVNFNSHIDKNLLDYHYCNNDEELNYLIKKINFDYFISLNPFVEKLSSESINKLNKKFCLLMHGDDSFLTIDDWEAYNCKGHFDLKIEIYFLIHNYKTYQYYYDLIKKYSQNKVKKNNYLFFNSEKVKKIEIGDAQICNEILNLNANSIKSEFNIPLNKKIILYLPFPFLPSRNVNNSDSWQISFSGIYHCLNDFYSAKGFTKLKTGLKFIYYLFKIFTSFQSIYTFLGKNNEKNLLLNLRNFCNLNGYYLISKPKSKYSKSIFLNKYSDITINDNQDEYFPSVFQKLLYISNATISYNSTAIRESSRYKIFNINIKMPKIYFDNNPLHYLRHSDHQNSRYEYDGVIKTLEVKNLLFLLKNNNLLNLFKVSNVKRKKYVRDYLSSNDVDSGEQFINFTKKNIQN